MAIWMMCDKDAPGAVRSEYWSKRENTGGEKDRDIYLRETHTGLVLELRERNGYDDSDFYAVVWNPEKGETERVEYASTRGWTYPNGATVDATPEVLAAYEAWIEKRNAEARRLAAEEAARRPEVGRTVRVVKGRKVKVGEVGEVFWYGRDKFERRYYTPSFVPPKMRVGVKLASGEKVFTAADNVEVIAD